MVNPKTLTKWKKEDPARYEAFKRKHQQQKTARIERWKREDPARYEAHKLKQQLRRQRRQPTPEQKARMNARSQAWQKKNPEKTREIRKRWGLANPDYQRERLKEPKWYWQNRYSTLKINAAKRHLSVGISLEDLRLMEGKSCYLCGAEGRMSIDRINNNIGYERGNIRPCCLRCNKMKSTTPLPEFLSHLQAILRKQSDPSLMIDLKEEQEQTKPDSYYI